MFFYSIFKKAAVLVLVYWGVSAFAYQNVLILNSYNQGFTHTDEITRGIWDVLKGNDNLNIRIEYMDILTVPEQKSKKKEKRELGINFILANKYKNIDFDIIISIDYEAFDFVAQHRNTLWENVPVVACGISKKQANSVDLDSSLWYGIYEFYNVPAQIDFISRLQNNIKRIIFITDNTEAGQDIGEQLSSINYINPKDIILEEWKEPLWEDIPELLSNLDPQQDAVVIASVNRNDSIGNIHKSWQLLTGYLNEHSVAPVYSFHDVGVQNGVVGGNLIFAPLMGKNTGLLAASILAEDGIYAPGFQKSMTMPMIDDQAATDRNLNLDKLPPETIRLNKIEPWLIKVYQRYMYNMKNAIIAELVIILILGFSFYVYFKISNRKLQLEKNAVEEMSKAKSLFLAAMGHEIRTPLNSMLGFSELLSSKGSNLSEEQKEWCKSIEISSYYLRDTLNNIMDFSKMEAGMFKVEEKWTDIFALCDDLISVCRHHLFYRTIKFDVMPSIYMPRYIKTDPVRLKQVLINLVSNAIKFTSKGSVYLMIKPVGELGDNENKIHFEVIDTGIGIPKEKIKKIFEAFRQIDSGNSRKYGGAGLGLTISQNIIDAMNSNLEVQSNKNGSRFYFTLNVKTKRNEFYRKFLNKANQKVIVYNQDKKVLDYISECIEATNGISSETTNIKDIFSFNEHDLLIAQANMLTDSQIKEISVQYPRVILVFYQENDRVYRIKRDYPKIECLMAPVKSAEAMRALQNLYA